MANLFSRFGFSFDKPKVQLQPSPVLPRNEDSAFDLVSNSFGYAGWSSSNALSDIASDNALIEKYRNISEMPEVDNAIEEIVSEAVVIDGENDPITLNTDAMDFSPAFKKKVQDSFSEVLGLLDFKNTGHDLFKRFYIDGRIYFYLQVNEQKPKEGLKKIEWVDPRKIKAVREIENNNAGVMAFGATLFTIKDEYYVYSESMVDNQNSSYFNQMPTQQALVRIEKDAVAFASSGLTDTKGKVIYSYLHKAMRVANQVKWLEDAVLIYYLSRAPERRAFYISTMNVPKPKRESFMREVMARFKQKVFYDPSTGELNDERKLMSLTDDYWIPRDDAGTNTEIDNLSGSSNLADMTLPLTQFREKFLKSLGVPIARLDPTASMEFSQSATEVTRDELKFSRFIARVRNRFVTVFDIALKAHLMTKKIITSEEEWQEVKKGLKYVYTTENHFSELRDTELLNRRLGAAESAVPMIGKFFTLEQIQKRIMKMSEEDIADVEAYAKAHPESMEVDREGNITTVDKTTETPEPKPKKTPLQEEFDSSKIIGKYQK